MGIHGFDLFSNYQLSQLHPWLVPHWVQTPQAPALRSQSQITDIESPLMADLV